MHTFVTVSPRNISCQTHSKIVQMAYSGLVLHPAHTSLLARNGLVNEVKFLGLKEQRNYKISNGFSQAPGKKGLSTDMLTCKCIISETAFVSTHTTL